MLVELVCGWCAPARAVFNRIICQTTCDNICHQTMAEKLQRCASGLLMIILSVTRLQIQRFVDVSRSCSRRKASLKSENSTCRLWFRAISSWQIFRNWFIFFSSGFIRFLVSEQKAVLGQIAVTLCLSFYLLPHLIVFQSRARVFKYRLSDKSSENTGALKNKGIN